MEILRKSLLAAGLVVLAIQNTGCSVLGIAVGAALESGSEDIELVGSEVLTRSPGTKATTMLNGRPVTGKLGEPLTRGGEAYRSAFAATRESMPTCALPRLGEPVRLPGDPTWQRARYAFAGTDRYRVVLRHGDSLRTIRWAELDGLVSERGVITGKEIGWLVDTGQLPVAEGVELRSGSATTSISFDTTQRFSIPRVRNAKWVGFLVGLTIDIVVLVHSIDEIVGPSFSGVGFDGYPAF